MGTEARRVSGIVLAAGFSSRAGAFKMELDLAGRPVLHWVLAAMSRFVDTIVVVGGFRLDLTNRLVDAFPRQGVAPEIRVVENPDYATGMFSSVLTGARAIAPGSAAFLIPGDCPLVRPEVYQALLATTASVAIPLAGGRKGHPVLLAPEVVAALAATGASGSSLKEFLATYTTELVGVADDAIWRDLDTPDDYAVLRDLAQGGTFRDNGHHGADKTGGERAQC